MGEGGRSSGEGYIRLENKVHQKTVLVQFGLVNFRLFKVGKNWIASGFRPRNDKKYFRPKWTIKYTSLRSFALELLKFLRNWSSNLKPYHYKKPFTKRQKAFYSETERFELSVQVTPHNTLAGCRLKPTRPRFLSDNIYNITNILFFKIFI